MKAAAVAVVRYVFPVIGKLVPAAKLGVSETVSSHPDPEIHIVVRVELRKVEIPAVLRSRSLYFEDLAETEGLEW
jgi:hypothetical protein